MDLFALRSGNIKRMFSSILTEGVKIVQTVVLIICYYHMIESMVGNILPAYYFLLITFAMRERSERVESPSCCICN